MRNYLIIPVLAVLTACSDEKSDTAKADTKRFEVAQRELLYQAASGNYFIEEIKEQKSDKSLGEIQVSAERKMEYVKEIEKLTREIISKIEELKLDVVESAGGRVSTEMDGTFNPIEIAYFDFSETDPTAETAILAKQNRGKDLKQQIINYRSRLCKQLTASASGDGKLYRFIPPTGLEGAPTMSDVQDNLLDYINSQPGVKFTLRQATTDVYLQLTHTNKDWNLLLADKCNWQTAFQVLLDFEEDILTARSVALKAISREIHWYEYQYDKIIPVVIGPDSYNPGQNMEIQVLMHSFHSDKRPLVEVLDGPFSWKDMQNGKVILTGKATKKGKYLVRGTITTLNADGVPKTMLWEKVITVK